MSEVSPNPEAKQDDPRKIAFRRDTDNFTKSSRLGTDNLSSNHSLYWRSASESEVRSLDVMTLYEAGIQLPTVSSVNVLQRIMNDSNGSRSNAIVIIVP